jgi:2-haloacid dehalogenase
MPKYQTLLFDLDDTLLDFGVARLAAHRASCEAHGHGFDDELYQRFNEINDELWKAYEEGKIPQAQVRQTRHERLFKERGHVVDGAIFDATYSHHLAQGFHPIPGALELVAKLSQAFPLYIVSNGVATIQASRLAGSGLRPHFKDVFVSEAIGSQKPHKAFFDHVFSQIPAFEPGTALIIGDSLSADIAGGNAAGIDTCWFNPGGKPNASGHRPTYEVRSYGELQAIVASEG